MGVEVPVGDACRRADDDEGDRHRAPARVGAADDRGVGHGRMPPQDGLDLRGIDVLAARHDQVVATIGHAQAAGRVEGADIAGPEPAVGEGRGRLRRTAVVAGEHHPAADLDLADLVDFGGAPAVLTVARDDAQLDARQRPSGRGRNLVGLGRLEGRDAGRRLGSAVRGHDRDAQATCGGDRVGRRAFGADEHGPQGRRGRLPSAGFDEARER